jgi:hypothetical protein
VQVKSGRRNLTKVFDFGDIVYDGNNTTLQAGQSECLPAAVENVLAAFNDKRTSLGVPVVKLNARLSQAARDHTIFMAGQGSLTDTDLVTRVFRSRFGKFPTTAAFGSGFTGADTFINEAFDQPFNSLGAAIYRQIGVGCVVKDSFPWVTLILGPR